MEKQNEIFIIDYKRTPIGKFLSKLSKFNVVDLSSFLVNDVCKKINKKDIDLVYIGNVLSSGNGQNIARQVSFNNDINAPSITLNRVCGSGMQSIIEGYNSILTGKNNLVLVGGVESMSNSPHLFKKSRTGNKFGNSEIIDSMLNDGLIDAFSKKHMGGLTEDVIDRMKITKTELDEYAKSSYKKARNAYKNNLFKNEILPIINNDDIFNEDEEVNKIKDLNKIDNLRSVFKKNGTITAGNASKLSDGACLLLIASKEYIEKNKIKPIAKIIDYDLSVNEPSNFTLAPVISIKKILQNNCLSENDIDFFEINEAFANVPIMANRQLNINKEKINAYGGAIAFGHPLGCSGARITATLITILTNKNGKLGIASICNGGGGATSLLIENLLIK